MRVAGPSDRVIICLNFANQLSNDRRDGRVGCRIGPPPHFCHTCLPSAAGWRSADGWWAFTKTTGARREGWAAEEDPVGQSRRSAGRWRAFQPDGEILLQNCCKLGGVDGGPNFLVRLPAAHGPGSDNV